MKVLIIVDMQNDFISGSLGTNGWMIDEDILNAWRNNKNTITIPELSDNTFNKSVFGSVDLVAFLKARSTEISELPQRPMMRLLV